MSRSTDAAPAVQLLLIHTNDLSLSHHLMTEFPDECVPQEYIPVLSRGYATCKMGSHSRESICLLSPFSPPLKDPQSFPTPQLCQATQSIS